MVASPMGFAVCGALLLLGWLVGSPLIVPTFAALAFGTTAIATLPALGGSSPLISVPFLIALVVTTTFRRPIIGDIRRVLTNDPIGWLLILLMVYAVVGSIFLPRAFAGLTTAFVASRIEGRVAEIPLTPVSGNITQTAYFLLSILSFFVVRVLLGYRGTVRAVCNGVFAWAILHAGFGLLDVATKLVGMTDLIGPIRTASYSMLTDVKEAGFSRIVGLYAEASSFGSISLGLLAFTFTYWRRTGGAFSLILSIILLALLLLSTSSTAYIGLAIVATFFLTNMVFGMLGDRTTLSDLVFLLLSVLVLVTLLAFMIFEPRIFDPVFALIDKAILNKASSESAHERFYWNAKSLQAFLDTAGLGIGVGSSRASSWLIAVVSQLGVLGIVSLGVMVLYLLRGLRGVSKMEVDAEAYDLAASLRAWALAGLTGASISSGAVDPGIAPFVATGVLIHVRRQAGQAQRIRLGRG